MTLRKQNKTFKLSARQLTDRVSSIEVSAQKLRIAEAENLTRQGSTPDEAVQTLKRETLVRWGTPVNGVQIGLINYAANNPRGLKLLPLVNVHLD